MQESHADLREWYVHCVDFRALKRRLVDDPPDPYDDHPSMSGPPFASAVHAGGALGNGNRLSAVELEQDGLLMVEVDRDANGGVADAAENGGGGIGAGAGGGGGIGGGGAGLIFPDPSSRAFMFEIKQVLGLFFVTLRCTTVL